MDPVTAPPPAGGPTPPPLSPTIPTLPPKIKSRFRSPFFIFIYIALFLIFAASGYYFYTQKNQIKPTPKTGGTTLVFARRLMPPTTPQEKILQNGPFICPVASALCQNKANYKEGTFSANLTAGSKLVAIFDGLAEGLASFHPAAAGQNEEFKLVLLTNEKLGLQAMYYLNGTIVSKKEVKAGDIVATSSGVPISFMDNKSFVFRLMKAKEGVPEQISPADFK